MRSMLNKLLLLVVVLSALFLMGCDEYSVVVENGSTSKIFGADVRYGDFSSGGGIIGSNTAKEHAGVRAPIREYATVLWRLEDGTSYERQVRLKSRLPRGFNKGDLIFTILDDGEVEFRYETWGEQDVGRARKKAEWLEANPPVFAEGELEITSDEPLGPPRTLGLVALGHPELRATEAARSSSGSFVDFILVMYELADRIKRDKTRYTPGDQVEVAGQMVCFRDGEEGQLFVAPCSE